MSGNTSPDGKWKIIIDNNKVIWIELTDHKEQFTIQEIVQATKDVIPEIWKK